MKPAHRMIWHIVTSLVIVGLLGWWIKSMLAGDLNVEYPNQPIQVVVPYGAGGGSDTFVRTLQKGIVAENLLDQPLVINNMPGGSGTIGSREVKDAKPDGYKILCQHNSIITAKLAGTVDYGAEAFEPIAMTGELSLVIMVREDAPYADLPALLNDAKARPKQVRFGANRGAPAYFTTLQMEKSWPGAEFSIVSADGGADRYAKIIGGHLEAGIFSLSELLDFRGPEGTPPERNVCAIAIMGSERHPSVPDLPTAVEQNVPVLLSNAHYWWAPKGTPKPVVQRLAMVFKQAMENETVKQELARLRVDIKFEQGQELQDRLRETITRFEATADVKATIIPRFTNYVLAIVAALFIWMIVEMKSQGINLDDNPYHLPDDHVKRPLIALSCLVVLMFYVLVLGRGWFPFAITTTAMVFVVGNLMTRWHPQHWLTLAQLALLTGFGTHFVFTQVFETILP